MRRTRIKEIIEGKCNTPKKNFALKQAIEERGQTQRLVAYTTGMDYGRLNSIVNGWIRPRFSEKQILAAFLEKPIDVLFSTNGED